MYIILPRTSSTLSLSTLITFATSPRNRIPNTAMATIGNTFGAMEIGSIITVFLFGIITLQTHMYFERFSQDRIHFKILVRVFVLCCMIGLI